MGRIRGLKKLFQPSRQQVLSYKRQHFLNMLSTERQEDILLYAEACHIPVLLPDVSHKPLVVFNDSRRKNVLSRLQSIKMPMMINYCYRGEPEKRPGKHTTVLAGEERFALRKNFFEVVVCPMVLEEESFVIRLIRSLSGYLRNGSRVILSVTHPQMENMIYNQNPATSRVAENSITKWFRTLRENHFYTEDMHEAVVDNVLRPFFAEANHDYFSEYRNTPVCLMFRAVKYEKKKTKE